MRAQSKHGEGVPGRRVRRTRGGLAFLGMIAMAGGLSACGGGMNGLPPPSCPQGPQVIRLFRQEPAPGARQYYGDLSLNPACPAVRLRRLTVARAPLLIGLYFVKPEPGNDHTSCGDPDESVYIRAGQSATADQLEAISGGGGNQTYFPFMTCAASQTTTPYSYLEITVDYD